MPYYRFNCEGSAEEAPARFAVTEADGLVHLRIARRSATSLLTMDHEQAANLSLMLKGVSDAPTPRPYRRPRLAQHDR